MLGVFFFYILLCAIVFKQFGYRSGQTFLCSLIWVQIVCKCYLQTIKAVSELHDRILLIYSGETAKVYSSSEHSLLAYALVPKHACLHHEGDPNKTAYAHVSHCLRMCCLMRSFFCASIAFF